ncbi:hypothetical protein [Frateuria sp. Soil773]|uniref:hypothetical protein n=1 Tax=Frateuria sp. Soil773 TaxID=1736407 RepID=UPI001F340C39|nr:hypothetical protein [Frateuria sp. Soil773]
MAHIQALLEAKQERVRQGPNWPGAEQQAHPGPDAERHVQADNPSAPEAARIPPHERGGQDKRGRD